MLSSDKLQINKDIRAHRVLVIDQDGEKRGEFLKADAIKLAEDEGLDLVMVADGHKPVCKIMDYGKHLYEQKKKAKQNSSTKVKLKEIKIKYNTDDNYISVKANQARGFLKDGHQVKITVRFWGRQRAHVDIVRDKCQAFAKSLSDAADVQTTPRLAGNNVYMILVPKK